MFGSLLGKGVLNNSVLVVVRCLECIFILVLFITMWVVFGNSKNFIHVECAHNQTSRNLNYNPRFEFDYLSTFAKIVLG